MKNKLRRIKNFIFRNIAKRKIYQCVTCVLFLILMVHVIISATYLFRNNNTDRLRMVGIKEEDELDMIYIGASAAFAYWQPLKAWNDYGFTSYNYAVNTVQAEGIKYLMKEALKTQDPELVVVDLRAFQYWEPTMIERGARTIADQIDYSWNRFEFLNYYFSNREKDEEADYLSYYLEIAKYHTNREALQHKGYWERINNTGLAQNKGWETQNLIHSFEEPEGFMTNERAELPEKLVLILEDLLEYCEDNKLEVLFTVCPYVIEEEHQQKYNALKDIIEDRGFSYINTNEYYDEMGINFQTDFYDRNHVNCLGSEKYTQFLGAYIVKEFSLPNNRGDEVYKSWDEEYAQFVDLVDNSKKELNIIINGMKQTENCAKKIRETEDVYEWELLTRNNGFVVFINGEIVNESKDMKDIILLEQWGINLEQDEKINYMAVLEQGKVLYSKQGDVLDDYQDKIEANTSKEKEYILGADKHSVIIDNVEYSLNGNGLNIVVYNKHSQRVVDIIEIIVNDGGNIKLER